MSATIPETSIALFRYTWFALFSFTVNESNIASAVILMLLPVSRLVGL